MYTYVAKWILVLPALFFSLDAGAEKPSEKRSEISEKRVVYKTVEGLPLHVDLFLPEGAATENKRPAIAFFHGGGWAFGEPSAFYETCRRYARMGYVTASFQYRLSINEDGSYPHPEITPVECTKDARSALRWMKKNSDEMGVDPEKIIVSGHSVGGQLSLATALCDSVNESTDDLSVSPTPAALIILSGTVNTLEAWCDHLLGEKRREIWSISPHHNLRSGMPPVLGFHGREDCTVKIYSIEFFLEKSRALGNDIEYVFMDGKKHYLAEGNDKYSEILDEDILERADAFLEKHGLVPE
jgi:acetyl esterase/lipase